MIRKADDTHTYTDFHFRKVADKDGVGGQASQGTRTVEYFYKNWQVLEERDDSDNLQRQYVYGRYIDEPLTLDDRGDGQTVADLNDGSGDDRVFYHCNTQYSTHALTDETGSIVEAYQYDAYGRPTVFTGPGSDGEWFTDDDTQQMEGGSDLANKYFFQGRRFDEETQMQYFRNRYYNSRLGRFISRDPMGVWVDRAAYGNGYSSLIQNPYRIVDPFGFWGRGKHGGITWDAFQSDYDKCLIRQIVDENKYADEINIVGMVIIGAGNPNIAHYTRAINQTPNSAMARYQGLLAQEKSKITQALRSDDCEKALDHIGIYLHFRQDFFAHAVKVGSGPGNIGNIYSGTTPSERQKKPTPDSPQGTEAATYPSKAGLAGVIGGAIADAASRVAGTGPIYQHPPLFQEPTKEPIASPAERNARIKAAIEDTRRQSYWLDSFKEFCCVCEDVD